MLLTAIPLTFVLPAAEILAIPGLGFFRRVTSTPDPDTFGKYRDTPPISIMILLCAKSCILLGRKSYIHLEFESRYGSHLYRETFAKLLGSGVVGTPPLVGTL